MSPSPEAALFAALFRCLAACPDPARRQALDALERDLGGRYDDLWEKAGVVLRPDLPAAEKTYGLWLLYLSLFFGPDQVSPYIGPDLAGDDLEPCLRVLSLAEGLYPRIEADLRLLAGVFAAGAGVSAGASAGAARFALLP